MHVVGALGDAQGRRLCRGIFGALAILGICAVQAQQSELDKMLSGQPFDADRLLEQIPDEDQPAGFNPAAGPLAPLPLFADAQIAMVLPLDAPGLIGEAAGAFLEGFVSAAEADQQYLSLETYRTDGKPESGLEAYRLAVANGADIVVGPLIRSAVELVARLPAHSTVPTLMLQLPAQDTHAGQVGAPQLFAFPLGGEAEIIQFGRLTAVEQYASIFVLVEDSALGAKLSRAFDRFRPRYRSVIPSTFRVANEESWTHLHERLRELIRDPEHKVAVFAAGGADFAGAARANVPGAIPIFALAATQNSLSGGGRSVLNLDGLRFFEMPYLLRLRGSAEQLVAGRYAARLRPILQRYVAAGVDAYELANGFAAWIDQDAWSISGATGTVFRSGSSFAREGVVIELRDGRLDELAAADGGGAAATR